MLPRAIYTFNAIPIKILKTFFKELEQIVLKFVGPEKAPNLQGIVEKEKHRWGHHNARFRAVLQSCDNKDSMVLAQIRYIDQWNRIQTPEMDPRLYGQLIFNKAVRISKGKMTVSSINGSGEIGQLYMEE